MPNARATKKQEMKTPLRKWLIGVDAQFKQKSMTKIVEKKIIDLSTLKKQTNESPCREGKAERSSRPSQSPKIKCLTETTANTRTRALRSSGHGTRRLTATSESTSSIPSSERLQVLKLECLPHAHLESYEEAIDEDAPAGIKGSWA